MGKQMSVLRNMNLVDMSASGERIKKNKTVVIENGRIASVLDDADPRGPARGHADLDLGDNYLMPGLIDLHVHCTNPFIDPHDAVKFSSLFTVQDQVKTNLHNSIRGGVTTVRDMGSPPGIVRFMKMIERGRIPGPRIVPSFSMISCPGGYPDMVPAFNRFLRILLGGQFAERVADAAHAEKTVRYLAERGAAWIKTVHQEESYMFGHPGLSVLSDGSYEAIVRAAREMKKKTALHALSLAGFRKGIELKFNTIEHLPLEELSMEDVRMIVRNGTLVVPTLIAPGLYLENMLGILGDIITASRNCLVPRARTHTLEVIAQITSGKQGPALIDYHFLRRKFGIMTQNLRRLHEAGARIGFGTDAGGTDICLFGLPWLEMQLMSGAGLQNYEILEIATRKNAEALDLDHELGSLEPGKVADLVLVEGNPVEDVRNAGRVEKVWKNGKLVFEKERQ